MKRPLARLVLGFLGVQLVVAGFLLGQFVESFLEPAPLMMVSARRAGGLNRMASAAAAATEAAAAAAAAASDAKSKDGGEPEEAQARALKAQQLAGDDRLLLQPRKRNEFLPPSGHNRLHGADESIDNGPRERVLQLDWHLKLGFNNVRFQLEVGVVLAELLGRRLMLPSRLRMRRCIDEKACGQTRCVKDEERNDYWCPTDMFFDPEVRRK